MFAWWGQFVYRHRWAVLGVSAVMLAGSIVALFDGGTLKNSGDKGPALIDEGPYRRRDFRIVQAHAEHVERQHEQP